MAAYSLGTAADGSADPLGSDVQRWGRVGSAVLGGALLLLGLRRRSVGGTAIAVAGGWLCYGAISGRSRPSQTPPSDAATGSVRDDSGAFDDSPTVERSITVGKPADELSELVRDAESLGRIVGHFADVTSAGEDRHRWNVRGPLDRSLSWETRIVEDQPGERLRWEPVDGTPVLDEWSVEFRPAPGDRGTEVTLRARFDPPGGALVSRGMERLDVVPETLVGVTLDRFKSLAETGETSALEANPSARGRGDLL